MVVKLVKLTFALITILLLLNIIGCNRENKNTLLSDPKQGVIDNDVDRVNNNKEEDVQAVNTDSVQEEKEINKDANKATKDDDNGRQQGVVKKPSEVPVKREETKVVGEFAKYDNSRKSWWFRRQLGNKPATVNADIETLIKKYDGYYIQHTDEKILYLTFDEGYENGYTPKILDVLNKTGVHAAFFITEPYLKKHSDLVERMVNEGHIVGNHTVNHPGMPDITDDKKLEEEILGVERPFYEMFGENMSFFRPPKGEYSERTLALTKSLGYKTIFWSFAYADWNVNDQKGKDFAYETVMSGIHNGAILLLHAVSKDNANALEDIINDARAKGYEFRSLNELKY